MQVGDEHTAVLSAYSAWAADRAQGCDALLLAATRDQISELNARARADRLAAAGGRVGREARLVDGTVASAGDVILTRHNDRWIRITATDWVKNGDRFTIRAVHESGDLEALHHHTGRVVVLPIGYVREHVALGYASTIHKSNENPQRRSVTPSKTPTMRELSAERSGSSAGDMRATGSNDGQTEPVAEPS